MARSRLVGGLALALLVGAGFAAGIAAAIVWQPSLLSGTNASTTGEAEVRIAATPRADGSVRLGLQWHGDEGWSEVEYPDLSIVPADAAPHRRLVSSTLTVTTREDIYTLVDDHYAAGVGLAEFIQSQDSAAGIWCLRRDAPDFEHQRAYCDGLAEALGDDKVEVVPFTDLGATLGQLAGRLMAGAPASTFATTDFEALFALLELRGQFGSDFPQIYFPSIFMDPEPPRGQRYCVIGHGSDSFWWLLHGAAQASARHLGIDLDFTQSSSAEARADQIRQCVEEGAQAISVTLAEPEHVAEAIAEAREAGVAVVTYNSGADAALQTRSLMHVGLNDRKAGEIVGQRLTAQGVSGTTLCLVHEQANVGLTERCEGLADTYADVEVLSTVDGFEALSRRMTAGGVAAVILLRAGDIREVLAITQSASAPPTVAAIGFDNRVVARLLSGQVSFMVWDHAMLQGYLAVALAAMAENVFFLPDVLLNQAEVLIEPRIVTAEDARSILAGG